MTLVVASSSSCPWSWQLDLEAAFFVPLDAAAFGDMTLVRLLKE